MDIEIFKTTIGNGNENEIFVKPICDLFGIDYDNQVDKCKNDAFLAKSTGKKPSKTLFGDNHPRIFLSKIGFVKWILSINANTIRQDLREKFALYQDNILDFLYGSAERESQMRIAVNRKNQLILQRRALDAELNNMEKIITNYIDEKFLVPELPFKNQLSE